MDYTTVNLPIVLSDQEAKVVADVTLYNTWVGRVQYQFTVPPKYALLEPTDVITVTKDGAAYVMRVNSTKLVRNGMQEKIRRSSLASSASTSGSVQWQNCGAVNEAHFQARV